MSNLTGIEANRIKNFLENPLSEKPTALEAISISRNLDVPLHPKYTYFWEQLSVEELQRLRVKLLSADVRLKSALPSELQINRPRKGLRAAATGSGARECTPRPTRSAVLRIHPVVTDAAELSHLSAFPEPVLAQPRVDDSFSLLHPR